MLARLYSYDFAFEHFTLNLLFGVLFVLILYLLFIYKFSEP